MHATIASDARSYLNPRCGFVCADVVGLIQFYCGIMVCGGTDFGIGRSCAHLGRQPGGCTYAGAADGFAHHEAQTAGGAELWVRVEICRYQREDVFFHGRGARPRTTAVNINARGR